MVEWRLEEGRGVGEPRAGVGSTRVPGSHHPIFLFDARGEETLFWLLQLGYNLATNLAHSRERYREKPFSTPKMSKPQFPSQRKLGRRISASPLTGLRWQEAPTLGVVLLHAQPLPISVLLKKKTPRTG